MILMEMFSYLWLSLDDLERNVLVFVAGVAVEFLCFVSILPENKLFGAVFADNIQHPSCIQQQTLYSTFLSPG